MSPGAVCEDPALHRWQATISVALTRGSIDRESLAATLTRPSRAQSLRP